MVDELSKCQKTQGLFRLHPELPNLEEATFFWCAAEFSSSKSQREALDVSAEGLFDASGPAAAQSAGHIGGCHGSSGDGDQRSGIASWTKAEPS